MQELLKLLNRYEIKKKLFEIIIDNVNNNKILKNELNKALNLREHILKRMQNFISCLTHTINLISQYFIAALKFETIIDEIILHLNDEQIQDMKNSTDFSNLIKKYLSK